MTTASATICTRRRGGAIYPPVTDGLTHWWPYTEAGNHNDYVGTAHGTLVGSVTVSGDPVALQLPGDGRHSTHAPLLDNKAQLTVMIYVQTIDGILLPSLSQGGRNHADQTALLLMDNRMDWRIGFANNLFAYPTNSANTVYTGVFDGGGGSNNQRMYKDTTLIGQRTCSVSKTPYNPSDNLNIGYYPNANCTGSCNHVLIYDNALTADQLATMVDWIKSNA